MASASTDTLRTLVPLRVVLLTETPTREHAGIRTAVARAFKGGSTSTEASEAYLAAGEDLGATVLDTEFTADGTAARKIVADARREALHVLIVVFLYDEPSPDFKTWLTELDKDAGTKTTGRLSLHLLPIAIRGGTWTGSVQALDYSILGEYAVRPVYAAAHALVHAWKALGTKAEVLKIFISHAKLDGLPLAKAFKHQLDEFRGTGKFYDADDIPPGSDWREVLRSGVEQSVLIALRTNVYEERPWCVQEMDWAEDYGCPVVMLDARTQLVRTREFLPVGGAPCVQIPDGNLLRALQSGLREALRVRLFARQVDALADLQFIDLAKTLKVPRTSLPTLGMRCQDREKNFGSSTTTHVFVPEPFRETHLGVAEKLAHAYFPDAWLGTPKQFIDRLIGTGTK
jgi:hypothetical protein